MRKSRAECALGEEIEAGMDAAGYTTVRDLARDAGVSEASIGRWIRGRQTPEPQALARVAQVLGVDYDRLAAVTWPETAQPAGSQLTEAERLIIDSDLPEIEKQQLLAAYHASVERARRDATTQVRNHLRRRAS